MDTRRFHAFTLIELLVVISIIALLVSILLPALGSARETASQLSCMTRIRSLGQALAMYHAENSDYYPYGYDGRPSGAFKQKRYYQHLMTYLGLQATDNNQTDADNEILHDTVIWTEWASSHSGDGKEFGLFAQNPHMMGWINSAGYDGSGLFSMFTSGFQNVNVTDVESRFTSGGSQSSTVTFLDGFRPVWFTPQTNNTIFNNQQGVICAPHFEPTSTRNYAGNSQGGNIANYGGQMNVAFMDGHARSAVPADFPGGSGLASWQIDP